MASVTFIQNSHTHTYLLTLLPSSYDQVIGDGNLIMGSCHIAHDCKIGNNNIFANNTLLAGHVEVEVSPFKPKLPFL